MVGHGGSSAGSYLADPTSPIPSHCASIVATITVRVNLQQQSRNSNTYNMILNSCPSRFMWTSYCSCHHDNREAHCEINGASTNKRALSCFMLYPDLSAWKEYVTDTHTCCLGIPRSCRNEWVDLCRWTSSYWCHSVHWGTLHLAHCNKVAPHDGHHFLKQKPWREFELFNDTWSQYGHSVSCMTILLSVLANQQIRHQATCKLGYQYGDCIPLNLP